VRRAADVDVGDARAVSDRTRQAICLGSRWVARPRQWRVEVRVIIMQPPLNLAGNASHPMGRRLKQLRAKLRDGPQ
jgi:hypothetical protein